MTRAGLDAERVDAAHVRQHAPGRCRGCGSSRCGCRVLTLGCVAPDPAGGDRRCSRVVDVVVGDPDVRGVAHEDADGAREDAADRVDVVVGDRTTAVVRRRGSPAASAPSTFTPPAPTSTISLPTTRTSRQPVADLDGVAADAGDPAVLDRDAPGAAQDDRARRRPRGLHGRLGRGHRRVLEGEPAEAQALDEAALLAARPRGAAARAARAPRPRWSPAARPDAARSRAGPRAVEVPLAGRERLEDVLDEVARERVALLVDEGHQRAAVRADEPRRPGRSREGEALLDPEVQHDRLDVLEVAPRSHRGREPRRRRRCRRTGSSSGSRPSARPGTDSIRQ